jgi:hypothetical protein
MFDKIAKAFNAEERIRLQEIGHLLGTISIALKELALLVGSPEGKTLVNSMSQMVNTVSRVESLTKRERDNDIVDLLELISDRHGR